jgi:voltage-gated potassium channel
VGSDRRLLIALAGLVGVTAVGSAGFVLLEDYEWWDALYMTIITLSTVGFGEIKPLSPEGRLFTVGLIITGVGLAFYFLTLMAEQLVEGRLRALVQRTAMQRKIDHLEQHVILCGYGRLGMVVAGELCAADVPMVVVEADEKKERELQRDGLLYVIGSAIEDDVLERAGIERARAIVLATAADAGNLFITLAARERNPNIRIHTRGESPAAQRRLKQAGATQVVSAYQMGGARLAASILRPSVVDFLEIAVPHRGEQVDLEEIALEVGCALDGQEIQEIEGQCQRLRIIAIKRGTETTRLMLGPDTPVLGNDHLVVIGERTGLEKLAELAHYKASDSQEA